MDNVYEFECLPLDVPNRNNRIYPRAVMEKALAKYKKEFIDERRALVTTFDNAGDNSLVNLKLAVGLVTEAAIKDNKLVIKIETLDTAAFRSLLMEGKFDKAYFNVAPFGTATLSADGVVQDDYEIIGFHIDPDYGRKD